MSSLPVLCRCQRHYNRSLRQRKNCSLSLICMSFGSLFTKHAIFCIKKKWFCSVLHATSVCVYNVYHPVDSGFFTVVFMLLSTARQSMVPNATRIPVLNIDT